jgi:hypothetical protein
MSLAGERMAKQRAQRIKKRMTCELRLAGRAYRGIVLDLSETGVFIQTDATPGGTERLRIKLRTPDGSEFEVDATVARRQVAPPQLTTVVRGGLGLRVVNPPAAYFELIGIAAAEAARKERAAAAPGSRKASAPAAAAPPPPPPVPEETFRVRVKQSNGPRSRSFTVRAPSPEEARKRASAEIGRGWEILSIEAA